MNKGENNLILAEITNNIIKELEKRISNMDNQIHLLNDNELAKSNWNGQKVALNEAIKITQNEFMKIINKKENIDMGKITTREDLFEYQAEQILLDALKQENVENSNNVEKFMDDLWGQDIALEIGRHF